MSRQSYKHDGKLDDDYTVSMANGAWNFEGVIFDYKGKTQLLLTPSRALSLLAFLFERKDELEQLAKDVEHE